MILSCSGGQPPRPGNPPRWDVVDYATANAALIHPNLSRSPIVSDPPAPLTSHLLNFDGEQHRILRSAVVAALDAGTPSIIPLVRPAAAALLARIDGDADVAGAFIRPLVLTLVDRLLGLTDGGGEELEWWHQSALAVETQFAPGAVDRIRERVTRVCDSRRHTPRDDLISRLVADDRVAPHQLDSTIFFAFSASYVNTVNFLGRSLLALAANPDEFGWLREHRGSMSSAVEELLRYAEPPSRASMRIAATNVTIGETQVAPGTVINVYRAHANRDPARFSEPQRLNLQRRGPTSLAFGAGIHYCPGASLVRLVGDLTLLTFIEHVQALDTTDRTNLAWDFADELTLAVTRRHPASRTAGPPESISRPSSTHHRRSDHE